MTKAEPNDKPVTVAAQGSPKGRKKVNSSKGKAAAPKNAAKDSQEERQTRWR
jgi:hypothetical protein